MGILIFIVLLLAVIVLFSVQNASPVAVTFLFWSFDASLAVVIFLSLIVGIMLGAVVVMGVRRKPKSMQESREEEKPPKSDHEGTRTL